MAKAKETAVVVCTEKKGVFFGYATDCNSEPIHLLRARMCIYWTRAMKGVFGLASAGPDRECRISDAVDEIELRGVTCVIACTDAAAKKWEENTWKP